jgi:hypothetical protein
MKPLCISGVFLLVLLVGWIGLSQLSCRTSAPTDPSKQISLQLDAVPVLLKADSTGAAVIWATVLMSGRPAPDSTVVYFATSLGSVTPEAYSRDGLARATFTPNQATGVAAIVAQVKAVRDTVMVTVY